MNSFLKYCQLRESKNSVTSKIKLQKKEGSTDFAPFVVNRTTHPNLRILIKAFDNSDKVGVGYTTIDKNKGEHEPQLKKKTLYLVGGAVRDHLKGKTPRNYDLVTDATMSEIRMILTHAETGFTEIKDGEKTSKNKTFYVSRSDKEGKELEFTVVINGEKFELAPLSKSSKSRRVTPEKAEPASSLEDDSINRDFTINALYIPLTNPDGDNSELIDMHGGAHHLKNQEIVAVNDDLDGRLKDDPSTALRYIKMVTRFGNPDSIPEKHLLAIEKAKDLTDVSKDDIHNDFLSGLEHPDSNPKKFIGLFKNTGLLDKVIPGGEVGIMPAEFQGNRWFTAAWLLRNKDIEEVKEILDDNGWSPQEVKDIVYLVKLYQWGNKNNFDSEMFYDVKKMPSGLTKSKVKEWMKMVKAEGPEFDAFLDHDDSDLTPYVSGEFGRTVNPEYSKILGRAPFGGEFDLVKRILSTNKWKDNIRK